MSKSNPVHTNVPVLSQAVWPLLPPALRKMLPCHVYAGKGSGEIEACGEGWQARRGEERERGRRRDREQHGRGRVVPCSSHSPITHQHTATQLLPAEPQAVHRWPGSPPPPELQTKMSQAKQQTKAKSQPQTYPNLKKTKPIRRKREVIQAVCVGEER